MLCPWALAGPGVGGYKIDSAKHYLISNEQYLTFLHQTFNFYPWCQIVRFCPWCQIVRGVKLSVFTHGVKLSAVSNCPGVKLSGVKLSAVSNCPVSNCPRCQIVRQHCRCQIVRGVKLSWCQIVLESF